MDKYFKVWDTRDKFWHFFKPYYIIRASNIDEAYEKVKMKFTIKPQKKSLHFIETTKKIFDSFGKWFQIN